MGKESIADQIAQSLSFEIQAVPQEDHLKQDSGSNNKQPVNVKIKVRKKNQAPIQDGVLTIPPGNRQVRLISSDQTIMSFDLMMEHNSHMRGLKKSRKGIFGMLGSGGCLGTESDDDDYAYLPVPCTDSSLKDTSSNEDLKKDYTLSKSACVAVDRKPKHFFGKCKPGGCLDPPFSEDRYSYKPTIIPLNANVPRPSKIKDDKNIDKRSSMFDGKLFRRKAKSIDTEKGNNEGETDSTAVLSLFRTGSRRSSISVTDSNSIITYPIGLNSPRSTLEDNKVKRASENKSRKSINELSDTYFIQPKQLSETLNRLAPKQSNRTDSLNEDQGGCSGELDSVSNNESDKSQDLKIFVVKPSNEKLNLENPGKEPSPHMFDSQDKMVLTNMQMENETQLLQNDLEKYTKEENSHSTTNKTPNITDHIKQNLKSDFVESPESDVDHSKGGEMNEIQNNELPASTISLSQEEETVPLIKTTAIIAATTAEAIVATAIAAAVLEENQEKHILKKSNNLLLDDQNPQMNKSNSLNQMNKHKLRETDKVNPMANKSNLSSSKLMPESGNELNNQNLELNELNNSIKINIAEQRVAATADELMPESEAVIVKQNRLLTPSVDGQESISNTNLFEIDDLAKPEKSNNLSSVNNIPTDEEKIVESNINHSKNDLIENEIPVLPISLISNDQTTRLATDISKITEKLTEGKEPNNFEDIEIENKNETSSFIDIQRKVDKHVEKNQDVFDNRISEDHQNNQDHGVKIKDPLKNKHTFEIKDSFASLMNISRISKEPAGKQEENDTELYKSLLKSEKKYVAPDNTALVETSIKPKRTNVKPATEVTSNDKKNEFSDDTNASTNNTNRSNSFNSKLIINDSIRDSSQILDESSAKSPVSITSFVVINSDDTPRRTDENLDKLQYQSDLNLTPNKSLSRLPSIEKPSHMNGKLLNLTDILATNNVEKQRDETSNKNSQELIKIPSNDTLTHNLKQSEDREATSDLNDHFKPVSSVADTSHIPEARATYTQYETADKTETQNEFQNNYPVSKIINTSRKSSTKFDKFKAPIYKTPIFKSSIDSIMQRSGVLQDEGASIQYEPTVEENTALRKLSTPMLPTENADNKKVEIMPYERPPSNIFISLPKSDLIESDVVTVDLGLQSYVNENNERVLKTFDTQNEPAYSTKTTLAVIKSKLRQFDEDIRIPIDIDHDISIQIKTSKIQSRDKPLLFGGRTKIAKTVTNKVPDDKASDPKLHDILSSLYEEELVPLQKTLKSLKSEIEVLALNKDILRDKLHRIDKSKFTSPSKRCGCLKR